jgi:hypothetical protein
MLLFYQVAARLSLTTCWQIVELQDNNKLLEQLVRNKSVELSNLVASCQQAADNLWISWEQAVRTHPVDKLLEQHCCRFVKTCAFLSVNSTIKWDAQQFWSKLTTCFAGHITTVYGRATVWTNIYTTGRKRCTVATNVLENRQLNSEIYNHLQI